MATLSRIGLIWNYTEPDFIKALLFINLAHRVCLCGKAACGSYSIKKRTANNTVLYNCTFVLGGGGAFNRWVNLFVFFLVYLQITFHYNILRLGFTRIICRPWFISTNEKRDHSCKPLILHSYSFHSSLFLWRKQLTRVRFTTEKEKKTPKHTHSSNTNNNYIEYLLTILILCLSTKQNINIDNSISITTPNDDRGRGRVNGE